MNYYNEIKENLIKSEIYDRVKDYSKDRHKVSVYFETGKLLSEAGKEYGKNIIKQYSENLMIEVGKKYTERNLRYMRQFYLSFPNWNTVCSELSWSHYRTLMRVEEQHIRDFYMEEAIKGNWSVRQLERQIATCSYSRVIANNSEVEKIDNVNETTALVKYEANTVIKDPYMLEFLGLDNNVNYLEKMVAVKINPTLDSLMLFGQSWAVTILTMF